ncbi:MAG: hypothetical protein AAB229_01005, partial [Candidatus Hydrogenedentota bacterium]
MFSVGEPSRFRRFALLAAGVVAMAFLAAAYLARSSPGPSPGSDRDRETLSGASSEGFILNDEDRVLLEKIGRAGFEYFWNEANPDNGLVKDRAHNFERTPVDYAPCSVAAVGYALSSICVAIDRGWIDRKAGYERILTTLRFFHKVPHVRGFFYHFLDMKTGLRTWKSELSPIDSVLFLAGALHAGRYFEGTEIEELAQALYDRVD